METDRNRREAERVGLCLTCQFSRVIVNDRGTRFYFCERSKTDPRFPRYPALPIVTCAGYVPAPDTGSV
jgi:hypothetical protein